MRGRALKLLNHRAPPKFGWPPRPRTGGTGRNRVEKRAFMLMNQHQRAAFRRMQEAIHG